MSTLISILGALLSLTAAGWSYWRDHQPARGDATTWMVTAVSPDQRSMTLIGINVGDRACAVVSASIDMPALLSVVAGGSVIDLDLPSETVVGAESMRTITLKTNGLLPTLGRTTAPGNACTLRVKYCGSNGAINSVDVPFMGVY